MLKSLLRSGYFDLLKGSISVFNVENVSCKISGMTFISSSTPNNSSSNSIGNKRSSKNHGILSVLMALNRKECERSTSLCSNVHITHGGNAEYCTELDRYFASVGLLKALIEEVASIVEGLILSVLGV